jgi:hypothetical protein
MDRMEFFGDDEHFFCGLFMANFLRASFFPFIHSLRIQIGQMTGNAAGLTAPIVGGTEEAKTFQ